MANDGERRAGRVLRFAVTGALLGAPLAGCGDGEIAVNEPAPPRPEVNEPAPVDPEPGDPESGDLADDGPAPTAPPPEPRGPTPNLPVPTDDDVVAPAEVGGE